MAKRVNPEEYLRGGNSPESSANESTSQRPIYNYYTYQNDQERVEIPDLTHIKWLVIGIGIGLAIGLAISRR